MVAPCHSTRSNGPRPPPPRAATALALPSMSNSCADLPLPRHGSARPPSRRDEGVLRRGSGAPHFLHEQHAPEPSSRATAAAGEAPPMRCDHGSGEENAPRGAVRDAGGDVRGGETQQPRREITCEFVAVTRWKAAICGEYIRSRFKTYSHGVACNFIICFRNPGGDYEWADWDNPPPNYWTWKMRALFGPPDDAIFSNASDTPGFERPHSSDRERLRSSDDRLNEKLHLLRV